VHSIQIIDNIKRRNRLILDGLDPETATKLLGLFREALKRHILLLYYSGYRDLNEQNELYQKYLRGEGGKAAKPGYSWHNYRRAVDAVPIIETGEADWESEKYPLVATLGNLYGLKWGGWGDSPHFSDKRGETLEQLRQQSLIVETKKKWVIPVIIAISSLALLGIGYKLLKR